MSLMFVNFFCIRKIKIFHEQKIHDVKKVESRRVLSGREGRHERNVC